MQGGILFDMDGVLVASGRIHAESWRMVAKRAGLTITDEQFKESFGQTSQDIIRLWWGSGVTDDEVRRIDEEKEKVYRSLVSGLVPLTIGVRETLWHLQRAGHLLAVATSGPLANVDLVLDEGGMRGFFSAVVTREDITRGKPAPDVFLRGAEKLALLPARCVVVEDAPVGIEAALAANMRAIGFVGTHPAERLEACGAHRVVKKMSEITPELISELLA